MDAITALMSRVSPLRLSVRDIDQSALDQMLDAGLRAPDHGRLRPWRFIVVRREARARLGEVMAEGLRHRNPAVSEASLKAEREKPLRAPLIVIVAAALRSDTKIPTVEQVESTAAAAQNILLAAHGIGLGGFWRTGAAAYDPHVKHALGLKAEDQIVALLYIGHVETPGAAKYAQRAGVVEEWDGRSQEGSG